MSLDTTLARIAQIETALAAPSVAAATALATGSSTAPSTAPSTASSSVQNNFANTLQGAMANTGTEATTGVSGGSTGQAIVSAAASQIGETEQPPGSNNSPAIAMYRSATAGAQAGEPWCAYFVSWAARQAGEPLGAHGQGFGYVGDIWSWAQQTGRAIPNGPGVVPAPGDLIVFGDHHVGIVEKVLPNGSIETIEGNYNNQVSQVIRGSGEATGYVRMG
jgi:hypothetical protein